MALKNCVVCNSSFNGNHLQKTCSHECKESTYPLCKHCGVNPVKAKSRIYCSLECRCAEQTGKKREPPKNMPLCLFCKKNRVREKRSKYCSRECLYNSSVVPHKPCTFCGEPIKKNGATLYCSRSCEGKNKTKERPLCPHCKKNQLPNSKQTYCSVDCWANATRSPRPLCAYCRKNPVNRKGKKYCSSECYVENNRGENHVCFTGGNVKSYGPSWSKNRRLASKRDNGSCQHCGKRQTKKDRALDVHHIVPFREFGYIPGENDNHKKANVLTNLICLCRSCHKRAELGKIPIQPRLI